VWSDIWHVIEPQFTHLISTGEGIFVEDQMLPMRRFGLLEETYWNYSFTPIRGEDGSIAGVFNSGSETTRHVLSQRQMRFLLDIGEAFRTSTDVQVARRAAIEMLGQHLKADRVGFREIESEGSDELAVIEEWTAPGVGSVGPAVRMSDLGSRVGAQLKAGHVLRIDDVAREPDIGEARRVFESMGVAAAVAVPWIDRGRLTAVIFLHSKEPRAWNDFEVSTAEKVLERTVLWMERERAAERERIMTREIDHRARNALAVAQSVVRLTDADDVDTFREKIEDRIAAMARAHALLSSRHWEPIELRSLLEQELVPYAESGSDRVQANGPSVLLRPEQAQTLALLLHELATNAAKYGALRAPGGRLGVSWRVTPEQVLEIDWTEREPSDAKPAMKPERKSGFGSTLLTRVVEQQLGGTMTRSFDETGLRCVLAIPLSDARLGSEPPAAAPGGSATEESDRKSVLIVEDEAIIALDLEEIVGELGYDVFRTVSSVADGLKALEAGTPSLAIVDMNLAGHSSRPIAEALSARGVPLIFATGYADAGDLPESLARAPRLSKPISSSDLKRTIAELAG
jgi:two-component sensor histidine kinase